jgi:hypothetical protein
VEEDGEPHGEDNYQEDERAKEEVVADVANLHKRYT